MQNELQLDLDFTDSDTSYEVPSIIVETEYQYTECSDVPRITVETEYQYTEYTSLYDSNFHVHGAHDEAMITSPQACTDAHCLLHSLLVQPTEDGAASTPCTDAFHSLPTEADGMDVDSESDEHKCGECSKVFTHERTLNLHMTRVHKAVKQHQCKQCCCCFCFCQ